MTVVLALPRLYDAVVARFAADASVADPPVDPPAQSFGWRERAKTLERGHRIVWIPGDDSNGDLGALAAAKYPGQLPRPLATLGELFTVYLEAVDLTAAENERAQYQAARLLYDAWYRAVYLAARGTFTIKSIGWVTEQKERRFGASIRIVGVIEASIVDDATAIATLADARAVIDVAELDHSEEIETAPAPPAARAATTEPLDDLAGEQTIDGVALVAGDRVLVMSESESDADLNGIFVVASGAWARTDDVLEHGFFIHVEEGAENGDAGFELTTPDPIVVGTTPLAFERVSP